MIFCVLAATLLSHLPNNGLEKAVEDDITMGCQGYRLEPAQWLTLRKGDHLVLCEWVLSVVQGSLGVTANEKWCYETHLNAAVFKVQEGPTERSGVGRPLETGEGEEGDPLLVPAEGRQPCPHSISPV